MNIIIGHQCWQGYTTELIVAYEQNEIIGSVCVSNYDDETWMHSLFVKKCVRKSGVANQLLGKAETYATHKPIMVRLEDDAPAWLGDYYIKRGYKIVE